MFNLIPALIRAWQAGQIIRSPARWKSGGELTSSITIIVSSLFTILIYAFPKIADYLTPEMATLFGTLIIATLGIIQIIIGRVTTKKEVGLNVLFGDDKDLPNQGRREDDFAIPPIEKRVYGSRYKGPAVILGQGPGKVTPQGKDVV